MGFTKTNSENFEVYLTPMAREKLYTGEGGKIKIKYFSLHDGDINYTKSAKTQTFDTTPAGKYTQVPNLRGEPTTIGVNGCQVYQLEDFILRKDMGSDDKCPVGYYKNELGVCVENRLNPQLPKEKIIKITNNNITTTEVNRLGGNNKSGLSSGGNSNRGTVSGGGGY